MSLASDLLAAAGITEEVAAVLAPVLIAGVSAYNPAAGAALNVLIPEVPAILRLVDSGLLPASHASAVLATATHAALNSGSKEPAPVAGAAPAPAA